MCLGSRNNRTEKLHGNFSNQPVNLKFTYWNIEGFKSKIVGNKLADPDFLAEVKHADGIGIVETHMHDEILEELTIPGFLPLNYKHTPNVLGKGYLFGYYIF